MKTHDQTKDVKKKKTYKKPTISSQKILEAGLTIACNGTTLNGRKAVVGPCTAGRINT